MMACPGTAQSCEIVGTIPAILTQALTVSIGRREEITGLYHAWRRWADMLRVVNHLALRRGSPDKFFRDIRCCLTVARTAGDRVGESALALVASQYYVTGHTVDKNHENVAGVCTPPYDLNMGDRSAAGGLPLAWKKKAAGSCPRVQRLQECMRAVQHMRQVSSPYAQVAGINGEVVLTVDDIAVRLLMSRSRSEITGCLRDRHSAKYGTSTVSMVERAYQELVGEGVCDVMRDDLKGAASQGDRDAILNLYGFVEATGKKGQ